MPGQTRRSSKKGFVTLDEGYASLVGGLERVKTGNAQRDAVLVIGGVRGGEVRGEKRKQEDETGAARLARLLVLT